MYTLLGVLLLLGVAATVGYVKRKKKKNPIPGIPDAEDTATASRRKAAAMSQLGKTKYVSQYS